MRTRLCLTIYLFLCKYKKLLFDLSIILFHKFYKIFHTNPCIFGYVTLLWIVMWIRLLNSFGPITCKQWNITLWSHACLICNHSEIGPNSRPLVYLVIVCPTINFPLIASVIKHNFIQFYYNQLVNYSIL